MAGSRFSDAAGLRSCLTEAGAKIAQSAQDLAFARGKTVGDFEVDSSGELPGGEIATYSIKSSEGGGWHIYWGHPQTSEPGISEIVKNPKAVPVVAYVKPDNNDVVKKADDCLDGSTGDDA